MGVLLINACVRQGSRTLALARHALKRLGGVVEEVDLSREDLPVMDREHLAERTEKTAKGDFTDPMFRFARQFAAADEIVVAAPYWDLSFPAVLKAYLESVNIPGITFEYGEDGVPRGLCRARRLLYVTTSGGPVVSDEPGYGYLRLLCTAFYGIQDTLCFKAEGLDVEGADVEGILSECRRRIDEAL